MDFFFRWDNAYTTKQKVYKLEKILTWRWIGDYENFDNLKWKNGHNAVFITHHISVTWPRSAVSGNRCESDCRSRGRELDPILLWRLIISTVILLPSAESFKKDCCQLQAKTCARSNG